MSSRRPEAAPLDLAGVVGPGDRIVVAQGVSEPVGLVAALTAHAADLPDASVFVGYSLTGLFDVEFARRIGLVSYGAMGSLSEVAAAGLLDVVPCHYSELPSLFREGHLGSDVVLLQVTPPDAEGLCSTGVSMDVTVDLLEDARVVVAEVNDQLPRHPDAVTVPYSLIDLAVEVSRPLLSVARGAPGRLDRAIAAHVAPLVPDGATIQLGIGATVDAIGALLGERSGLRVHSALAGDWLLDLAEAGALAPGDRDRPSVVVGAVMGSANLYDFVCSDPRVRMARIEDVQRPAALAAVSGLVAVNGAVEVDLAGQVNVELARGRRVSALGGHSDFLRGAQASPGGRSIVVLPSTAGRGRASRIVRALDSGWVSTPQSAVDAVVTEYGVAHLRGRSLRTRRDHLVAIAHPDHRAGLVGTDSRSMESA